MQILNTISLLLKEHGPFDCSGVALFYFLSFSYHLVVFNHSESLTGHPQEQKWGAMDQTGVFFDDGCNQRPQRKPTQTQREHTNSTQKGLGANPCSSWYEAIVRTTTPHKNYLPYVQ